MFKKSGQRGFTLIELLVVIAIIGILAATVLASLGSARSSGQDAKVKQQLASLRSEAEIFYGSHSNTYTGMCASAGFGTTYTKLFTGLTSAACVDSTGTAWAASADLTVTGSGFWCVDSTGASKEITASVGTASVCP